MSSPTPHPKSTAACSKAVLTNDSQRPRRQGKDSLLPTRSLSNYEPRPYSDQRQSPLLRLPSEIRLLIYSYLLPYAYDITFHPLTRKHPTTGAPTASHAVQIPGVWASNGIWTALLRTCRQLYDEGTDALYGGNAFHFALTSRECVWAFDPLSSTSRTAGGGEDDISSATTNLGQGFGEGGLNALNTPYARGLPVNTIKTSRVSARVLRRISCLSIRVEEDLARPETYARVSVWLREFVDQLAPHSSCCLQELRVDLVTGSFRYAGFPSFTNSVFWEFVPEKNDAVAQQWQFVLEPLVGLRGVKQVEIKGHVDQRFAEKLAGRMMRARDLDADADTDEMEKVKYATKTVRSGVRLITRSMRKFYDPILDWQLEGDCQRFQITCRCGKTFFDDFMETEAGGLTELRKRLQKAPGLKIVSTSNGRSPPSQEGLFRDVLTALRNIFRRLKAVFSNDRDSMLPQHQRSQSATDQSSSNASVNASALFLMSCEQWGKYGRKLHQDILDNIQSDKQLFSFLQQRLKKKLFFSMKTVKGILFVKFYLDMGRSVDVRDHNAVCQNRVCECLPPETRVRPITSAEYRCEPIPPKTFPPIGPQHLAHYLSSPSCIDDQQTWILEQFPKRTRGPLLGTPRLPAEGWGIFYQEGWDEDRLSLVLLIMFFIGSLVFGVLWSVMKMDIQGAFGVSSWWLSASGLFLAFLATRTNRL